MANTPLQNGHGHVYGPGASAKSEGIIPVWLEQNGSRVMGGLIDLSATIDGTNKVRAFWPKSIRTATPCYAGSTKHTYIPMPTYLVLEDVSASDTVVKIAKGDGLPLLVGGMSLALASDATKKISINLDNVNIDDTDGFYKLTITANAFGALAAGDVLVLETVASKKPLGLTKTNLIYDGMSESDLDNTKLNVVLCDNGRLIADTAPAVPAGMKADLQTVKWEDIY